MHRRGSDSHPHGSLRLGRSCRGRPHYRTRLSADRAGRGRAARPSWRRARIPWAVSAGGRARRECGSAPVVRPHQTRVPANDLRGCSIRARVRVGVALGDSSLRHAIVRFIASTACNRKPRRKPYRLVWRRPIHTRSATDSGRKRIGRSEYLLGVPCEVTQEAFNALHSQCVIQRTAGSLHRRVAVR